MNKIYKLKDSSIQEIIELLQACPDKTAILKLDPCDTDNPYPFESLYVDDELVMLSMDRYAEAVEYRKEQE